MSYKQEQTGCESGLVIGMLSSVCCLGLIRGEIQNKENDTILKHIR